MKLSTSTYTPLSDVNRISVNTCYVGTEKDILNDEDLLAHRDLISPTGKILHREQKPFLSVKNVKSSDTGKEIVFSQ
jgi:hypothetical protein